MRLGVMLGYSGEGFAAAVDELVDHERAGAEIVAVPEAYSFDAVSQLGFIAARTTRIELTSGIVQLYSRTPTLTAMTAAGLDHVSGGRFSLGLGTSGPQVVEGFHGVPFDKPLARTREIIEICRTVWARRRPLTNDGPLYPVPLPPGQGTGLGKPLKLITRPVRPRIPIWVAALGERNVALAAELAEGWLPLFFLPERAGEVFGPSLAAGAARRAPELPPLEIAAGGLAFVGEWHHARKVLDRFARPVAALYLGGMGARGRNFYNALARRYGYEAAAREVQDLYLAGRKDQAAAAVPDEFLQLTNLCGPPGFVQERVAALGEAGVSVLSVTPVGPNPAGLIEQLKSWAT
jgi:F420-dependent oxidoreductase-like protein